MPALSLGVRMTKAAARRAELCEQRDRLEEMAWDTQKTGDVREVGPVLQAYSVILKELDYRIACFTGEAK
jgi:hypothetical protein